MVDGEYGHLTVDNYLTMKAPDQQNYIDIQTIMGMGGPILQISQSLMTKSDTIVYGNLTSCTDPAKNTGGGAVVIGHGWTDSGDFPAIVVTDYPQGGGPHNTLWLKYSPGNPLNLQQLDWANLSLGNLFIYGVIDFQNNSEIDWTSYGSSDWTNLGGFMFNNSYNNLNFEFKAMCHNFGDGTLYPIMQMAYWNNGSFTTVFQFDMMGDFSYAGSLIYFDFMDDLAALRSIKTKNDEHGTAIYDPGTLKFLKNEQGLFSLGACIGWELSIQQKFLAKHDEHDQKFEALMKQIEDLQAQIQQLKTMGGAS